MAEQELRDPQERGLVLGPWRVLGGHMLRIRAVPLILGPDVPPRSLPIYQPTGIITNPGTVPPTETPSQSL